MKPDKHPVLLSLLVYVLFCTISFLSRSVPLALSLMVFGGILFPLIWGRLTGQWQDMGFTRANLRSALVWGIAAGFVTGLVGILLVKVDNPPADMALQIAIGIPIWLLLASPFQEFFFRGWLQSRLEQALGRWQGLLLTTLLFLLWHYFPSFLEKSTFPLGTIPGILATFGAGLLYGYSFQRTRNIIAPWLAHAISGIGFVLIGAMNFTQP
jgi:membrane protease YdiL (CAAX protease family)